MFLAFAAMAALTPLVGTYAAILGFAALYTLLWGRFRWITAIVYTTGTGFVLYALCDRMLNTLIVPPVFM